jgi:predicted DNA-binding transcriptional regulator YafY
MSQGHASSSLLSKMLHRLKYLRLHKNHSALRDEPSGPNEPSSEIVDKSVDTADIQDQLIKAILSKCKVELNYKGEGPRIICPHALYICTSGRIHVDSYQVSGHSSHSRKSPYWRPFDITKITELRVLDENFDTAHGYDPFSHKYLNAIVKI